MQMKKSSRWLFRLGCQDFETHDAEEIDIHIGIYSQGCAAIWSLANQPSTKVPLVKCGAIQAVLGAMRCNSSTLEVAISGCASLASLGNAGGSNKIALVKVWIFLKASLWFGSVRASPKIDHVLLRDQAGAVPCVLQAMSEHSLSTGVAVHGCAALWTMAINPTNKLLMIEAGVQYALLTTLQTHGKDGTVANKALGALHSLSGTAETAKTLTTKELISCVLQIVRLHMERPDVCEHGCGTLGNVCFFSATKN